MCRMTKRIFLYADIDMADKEENLYQKLLIASKYGGANWYELDDDKWKKMYTTPAYFKEKPYATMQKINVGDLCTNISEKCTSPLILVDFKKLSYNDDVKNYNGAQQYGTLTYTMAAWIFLSKQNKVIAFTNIQPGTLDDELTVNWFVNVVTKVNSI